LSRLPPSFLWAEGKKYGPSVTNQEANWGQTMPYSVPVSALSSVGKAQSGYFDIINAKGGVN